MFKLVLAPLVFLAVACGSIDHSSKVLDQKEKTDIIGTWWQQKCFRNATNVFGFEKKGSVMKFSRYVDAKREKPLYTMELEFNFKSTKHKADKNTFLVDVEWTKNFMTIHSQETVDMVNKARAFCNFDFKKDVRTELTKDKCVAKLANPSASRYMLFKIEGDKLYMGDSEEMKYTGETKKLRPVETMKESFFSRMKDDKKKEIEPKEDDEAETDDSDDDQ